MRTILAFIFMWLTPILVIAQDTDRSRQADEVKHAVGKIAGSINTKVQIVRDDLRELEGKIVGIYEDSFALELKDKDKALITIGSARRRKPAFFIKYEGVLQLESKEIVLSFVPDPMKSPYSSWEKLKALSVGEFLQVDLMNGKRRYGAFLRRSDDQIELMRGNTEINVPRDDIVRVYRVTGDTSTLMSKLIGGAKKGVDVSDSILPIGNSSARAHPGALGIGVAVGALIFILPKGKSTRVLAFAK